jgi:N6-L-threonylcarbamoyladenine synthase
LLDKQNENGWKVFIPELEFCTDNAAMIAVTGYFKYLIKEFSEQSISPYSRNNPD